MSLPDWKSVTRGVLYGVGVIVLCGVLGFALRLGCKIAGID